VALDESFEHGVRFVEVAGLDEAEPILEVQPQN